MSHLQAGFAKGAPRCALRCSHTALKCGAVILSSLFLAVPARAQFKTFGEWSISGGTNLHPAPGGASGFTAHGMAGLQYSVVVLELGGGVVRVPDEHDAGRPFTQTIGIDLPAGIALRIPVRDDLLIAAGVDVTGLLFSPSQIYQPHVDLLFAGRRRYRGIFLKALLSSDDSWPGYIGLGLKMTLKD